MGRLSKKHKLLIGVLIIAFTFWMSLESIQAFVYPSKLVREIAAEPELYLNGQVRVVGVVQQGSVEPMGSNKIRFKLTDGVASINVEYRGALPDTLKVDGITVIGTLVSPDTLRADQILAKCQSKYEATIRRDMKA